MLELGRGLSGIALGRLVAGQEDGRPLDGWTRVVDGPGSPLDGWLAVLRQL
jgi:hypothetical protein